jgi:hypothetical protein
MGKQKVIDFFRQARHDQVFFSTLIALLSLVEESWVGASIRTLSWVWAESAADLLPLEGVTCFGWQGSFSEVADKSC